MKYLKGIRTEWLLVTLIAITIIGCSGKQQPEITTMPSRPIVTESGKMTLGIMFFDNQTMSSDHDGLERLRMGIAGGLITELSKVDKLVIVERSRIDELRSEIEMQWKGDGFDQQTLQKFGKLLGAQALCFGQFTDLPDTVTPGGCSLPFTKKSSGKNEMRIDARIAIVETGAILKAEEVTGPKQELFKLIKTLGLKIADRLRVDLGVAITKADTAKIKTEDTVYSTVSMVKFEEAREQEKQAEVSLEEAGQLEDTLREAKELEAQRLFDDAKRKYEEALSISPGYVEAKQAIDRLGKDNAM